MRITRIITKGQKPFFYFSFFLFFLPGLSVFCQKGKMEPCVTGSASSFRALSVVTDSVLWLGGSGGQLGHSLDGGKSWNFYTGSDPKTDFRSIYGFDRKNAVAANAGSPAVILRTQDGGITWTEVHRNAHKDAFIDGIDFWPDEKNGLAYGDPMDGRLLLLRTVDGGFSWRPVSKAPETDSGEASFAASGTGIRCFPNGEVLISTGGVRSRLWHSLDSGKTWKSIDVPVLQGERSKGIYSFDRSSKRLMVVGGDWKADSLSDKHILYSDDKGKSWFAPEKPTRGYRECVIHLGGKSWLAVGPKGSDLSTDNGITWNPVSDEAGLHVVRKARKGNAVFIAGGKGKLFRFL